MDLTAWALYLLIAGALLGAALLHYRLREPRGAGRRLLAVLRGLALAGVVLLMFNPRVPTTGAAPSVLALIDGSASMRMPTETGSAWDAAAAAVDSLAPDRTLVVGGGAVARGDAAPALHSRLGPALRAAVEAGPERVVLFTDGAVADPVELRRVLETARGASLRVVGGARQFNAGVIDVRTRGWGEVGQPLEVEVSMAAVGVGGPDSVDVALRRGDRELASRRVATPPGREMSAVLRYTPNRAESEPVRLDAVLIHGGSVPDDDRRSVYVEVSDEPAGVVLVSLTPGQEPRFLLPVLARATGLPVRGWAAVTPGRWVRIGADDAGHVDGEDVPRRALARADVVVAHGLRDGAPPWVLEAVETAPRVLVFPADDAPGLPLEAGPARAADWYVAEALPASPVAPLMAGAAPEGLPPLAALRTAATDDFWAPAMARAGGQGEGRPVLLAGEAEGRRVAVALAEGYWRWAFAGEVGRAFYERFWAAVGGWLAELEEGDAGSAVEPVERVVGRGEPPRWRVPGGADSAVVRLEPTAVAQPAAEPAGVAEEIVRARTVAVNDGVAALPAMPPGYYRYTVTAGGEVGTGEITVSGFTAEFTRPVTVKGREGEASASRRGSTAPLRSMPWGYMVVLALLSVEWVLRRRWGLR